MKKNGINAFSLAEMLVAVLILSIMLVVMAPVMTKKAKQPKPEVQIIQKGQDLPAGAIILWYGDTLPDGWVECSGQSIDDPGLEELKSLVTTSSALPDLNILFNQTNANIKWIIKVKN